MGVSFLDALATVPEATLENHRAHKMEIAIFNKEEEDLVVLGVSGSWSKGVGTNSIDRNITATRYDLRVPAGERKELVYALEVGFPRPGTRDLGIAVHFNYVCQMHSVYSS